MFHGKMKAVTFSYDDGTTQDQRLIKLFNKYGLKGTFNLNSQRMDEAGKAFWWGTTLAVVKPKIEELQGIYAGHEVAVHTLTHPNLTQVAEDAEVIRQVVEDQKNLSEYMGYPVVGMAYPGGGVNNDERVADLIRNHTSIAYARTTTNTLNFDLQTDLIRFNPTVGDEQEEDMFALADKFLALKPERPQIFSIWGHSFALDHKDKWEMMEAFCKKIAGHDDIFYGTNREVLL